MQSSGDYSDGRIPLSGVPTDVSEASPGVSDQPSVDWSGHSVSSTEMVSSEDGALNGVDLTPRGLNATGVKTHQRAQETFDQGKQEEHDHPLRGRMEESQFQDFLDARAFAKTDQEALRFLGIELKPLQPGSKADVPSLDLAASKTDHVARFKFSNTALQRASSRMALVGPEEQSVRTRPQTQALLMKDLSNSELIAQLGRTTQTAGTTSKLLMMRVNSELRNLSPADKLQILCLCSESVAGDVKAYQQAGLKTGALPKLKQWTEALLLSPAFRFCIVPALTGADISDKDFEEVALGLIVTMLTVPETASMKESTNEVDCAKQLQLFLETAIHSCFSTDIDEMEGKVGKLFAVLEDTIVETGRIVKHQASELQAGLEEAQAQLDQQRESLHDLEQAFILDQKATDLVDHRLHNQLMEALPEPMQDYTLLQVRKDRAQLEGKKDLAPMEQEILAALSALDDQITANFEAPNNMPLNFKGAPSKDDLLGQKLFKLAAHNPEMQALLEQLPVAWQNWECSVLLLQTGVIEERKEEAAAGGGGAAQPEDLELATTLEMLALMVNEKIAKSESQAQQQGQRMNIQQKLDRLAIANNCPTRGQLNTRQRTLKRTGAIAQRLEQRRESAGRFKAGKRKVGLEETKMARATARKRRQERREAKREAKAAISDPRISSRYQALLEGVAADGIDAQERASRVAELKRFEMRWSIGTEDPRQTAQQNFQDMVNVKAHGLAMGFGLKSRAKGQH